MVVNALATGGGIGAVLVFLGEYRREAWISSTVFGNSEVQTLCHNESVGPDDGVWFERMLDLVRAKLQ